VATTNCAASNTAYTYDANGFRNQATDAEGRITKWVKNSRGLPTSTTEGFGTAEARTTATSWDATRPLPTQIVKPGLTTNITYNSTGNVTSLSQVDTTTTALPYSTNGQTRTTAFGYTSFTWPTPPPIGPTGTPLSDVALTIVNPNAETGDTMGWTSTIAISPLGVRTTGACAASKCFWGSGSSSSLLTGIGIQSGSDGRYGGKNEFLHCLVAQTCQAAFVACQRVRDRGDCLKAYWRCTRLGRPTIFAPGIWGQQ